MKILVTGSNGFIGTKLATRIEEKHEVLAIDRSYDISTDLPVPKVDLIINLAALNSSKESLERPRDYFMTNVLGNFNLLESAREMGAKYMYLRTVKEEEQNPYGVSKLCAGKYVEMYRKAYGLEVILNTVGNLYGPGGDQFFVNQFVNKVVHKEPITIFGNGEEKRNILHIDDLIDLLVKQVNDFSTYQLEDWDVNGGEENTISVKELLEYLGAEDVTYTPELPGQAKALVSSSKQVLGWMPSIGWKEGVDSLREHYESFR